MAKQERVISFSGHHVSPEAYGEGRVDRPAPLWVRCTQPPWLWETPPNPAPLALGWSPPGFGMHKTSLHLKTEAQEDLGGWKGKGQVPARQCSRVLFGAHTWKVLTCSLAWPGPPELLPACCLPAGDTPEPGRGFFAALPWPPELGLSQK